MMTNVNTVSLIRETCKYANMQHHTRKIIARLENWKFWRLRAINPVLVSYVHTYDGLSMYAYVCRIMYICVYVGYVHCDTLSFFRVLSFSRSLISHFSLVFELVSLHFFAFEHHR